ncbi:hypothetical protein [Actinomycetospora lemnae]|uniref:DUF222 domain-containing protein n=1 Tax=Actinomycetospora lemnae TaxID=3019891 RepID=A0ABT5T1D0_9PSEU|nr:hypothetical protein [Actinomycetospora sp. DW7H6]MDD7968027.1 hypothetical protein [Actinomycetospora sp. DW7H6]
MDEPDPSGFSWVMCPETGVTAREAAVSALVARDDLGAECVAASISMSRTRRLAMIEDVRVLTGVLALELETREALDGRCDPAHRARLVHTATMRSEAFALCAALTLEALDDELRGDFPHGR